MVGSAGAGTQWSDELPEAIVNFMDEALLDGLDRPVLRLLVPPMKLMLCGAVHNVVRDPLADRFLPSAPFPQASVRLASFTVARLGRAEIRARRVARRLYRLTSAPAPRSPRGDVMFRVANRSMQRIAQRRGQPTKGRFNGHDRSRLSDFEPVQHGRR